MAELKLVGATKSFGAVKTLHGIDLEVRDGEFVAFVGPSGSGKSTLLRVIAGLEPVTSGEVYIAGERVTHLPASDRGLAMVFQSYALYPHMSVKKNMAFALENMRLPPDEIEARVTRAAAMLRLTDYLERKPKALSGGQRQRVAIGRAIVRDPKIFLFDEPLSNLDAELRVATRKELAALHAEIGGTMIYVTHDQVEAMTLADRIVVLRAGRIEQVGAPLDLYNRPANTFVAGFIGSPRMNFLSGAVASDGQTLKIGPHTIALHDNRWTVAPGAEVSLGIRPEHVEIAGEDGALDLTVDLIEQLGGETFVYGSAADLPQLTLRLTGQSRLQRGDRIRVRFDPAHLHLFDESGLSLARS